mmetsp:Transcript_36306/g.85226  ORF Transcript_36306/g.85226 Transcript_36306/m.85226 type:complete len:1166 (-) Transcript_36306:63-3560(-)
MADHVMRSLAVRSLAESIAEQEVAEESHLVSYVIIISCFGVVIGTFLRWMDTQLLPNVHELPFGRWLVMPPYSLSVLFAGILTSLIHDFVILDESSPKGHNMFTEAIAAAQRVDPHVILLVLLPPLIYASAAHMSWHVFRRVSPQAFILAFPGVIIQAYLVAAFFRYVMNYGTEEEGGLWDWDVALVFGSIVTATDPVAVVAALHSLGAPEKLADVIDGEALLNDGSAFVMFLIFLENVRSKANGEEPHTLASGTAVFFQLAAGGFALGALSYVMLNGWLLYVENDWRVELGVLLVGVYASFSIAENAFHVSGVLTVVTLGLLMSRRGKYAFSPKAAEMVEAAIPLIAHISETLIFYVAGVVAWSALYSHRDEVRLVDALILYAVLQAVRGVTVLLLYPLIGWMGYKLNWRESTLLVYAGLRGAVSLALALIALSDESIPILDRSRIHTLVASTAILTMLINGTTTPLLYQKLHIYPANMYRNVIVRRVMRDLEGPSMDEINKALCTHDKLYSRADWEVVRALVPCLSEVKVLPNNRLGLPHSTRSNVYDLELCKRILRSEPQMMETIAELVQAEEQAAPKRHRARTDASSMITRGANGEVVFSGSQSLESGGPIRRASTGAMQDVRDAMRMNLIGEVQVDPRKEWRRVKRETEAQSLAITRRRASTAEGPDGVPNEPDVRIARSGIFETLGALLGGPTPSPDPRAKINRSRSGTKLEQPSRAKAVTSTEASTTNGHEATGISIAPASPAATITEGDFAESAADEAMADRLAALLHRDRRLAPSEPIEGGGAAAREVDHFERKKSVGLPGLHVSMDGSSLPEGLRGSFEMPNAHMQDYTSADKRDGIVETLFAVIRKLYSEQYEHKQLAGGPLAVLIEALSSGEEYLSEYPHATAAAAFDLELDVLLYELPSEPAWRRQVLRVPIVGSLIKQHLDFYHAFDRTEALAGFIRAHEELAHVLSRDKTRMQVVHEAVAPALARAERELIAHHERHWALVSLQINMLAARAATLRKRTAMEHMAESGALTDADVEQLVPVFDRAIYVLDTVRFSLLAPFRFKALIKIAIENGSNQNNALESAPATNPTSFKNGGQWRSPAVVAPSEAPLFKISKPPQAVPLSIVRETAEGPFEVLAGELPSRALAPSLPPIPQRDAGAAGVQRPARVSH